MTLYDDIAKIAAGNNNTAGLVLISSITNDGHNLLAPFTPANYTRGERRFKANGVPYVSGDKTKTLQSFMTLNQYTYMRDTYEGLVTMHTWLENTTAYDYNAVLWFEEIGAYEPFNPGEAGYGWAVLAVKWNLTKIVVLP